MFGTDGGRGASGAEEGKEVMERDHGHVASYAHEENQETTSDVNLYVLYILDV